MWKKKESQIQINKFIPVLGVCFFYAHQSSVSPKLQIHTAASYLNLWASALYLDQLHVSGKKIHSMASTLPNVICLRVREGKKNTILRRGKGEKVVTSLYKRLHVADCFCNLFWNDAYIRVMFVVVFVLLFRWEKIIILRSLLQP